MSNSEQEDSPQVVDYEEDEEVQEVKEKRRHKHKNKPSKNEEEDEEEEEEDEDEENHEMDDFIVGDDEEEEEEAEAEEGDPDADEGEGEGEGGMEEESRKKKKKHKKKHRREKMELSEDDLDLINESRAAPVHKKLKKTKEIARSVYDEEFQEQSVHEEENEEDFIEQEEGEEGSPRKRRQTKRGGEGYSVLQMVFGQGYEGYQDDEYAEERKEEEDDLPEEDKRMMLKKKYEQSFDPAELQDKFATNADETIITEDVPERLQLRYKNRLCDNNEIVQETNWIADKLIMSKGLIDKNSENFRKNIMKVLEFLRISFYEIMYIHTYKGNEISLKPGELKLQDLWRIYDLDAEWTGIWSRRKLLEKSFEKLSTFMTIPELVTQLFNTSFDKANLDNLLDYCDFQIQLHPEANETTNEEKPFKKAVRQYIKPELKAKFEDFALNHLLSADNFGDNIYEGKMKNNPPYVEELLTDLTYKRYVDENIPRISNAEAFLTQLCDFVARELFSHPIIRKVVYRQYFEKILVSTEPTPKGKKEIDFYNINYCVKRLDGRALKDLEDEIWLRAVQNEKEGKIKIKFHFRWKDFNSDEIFAFLKTFYLYDAKIKNEASSQWNILRTEILTILLKTLMYPYMEKLARQELTENAEKKIIQECGKKFKEMISVAPYVKSEGDDMLSEIRVMSFVPDENNKIICVVVDKYGEFMDHKTYNYLLVNAQKAPVEYKSKQDHEEQDLKKFVEKYSPNLLVVGADNLSAKTLVKYLRDQSQKWSDHVKSVWIKYGDMTAPKIYAKMEVSKKELPDHPQRLKEAISLGRLQQSPLHECLKLWHYRKEENGVLYIIFHDLQQFVNQDKLVQEFEKAAIEVTNQVGIEINKILHHIHLSHPFQFVCGMGPRKAKNILDVFNQKLFKLTSRREMTEDKIVGKNIFTNMSGFIKVVDDEGKDLLDTTRIHPNDYRLAQKIAKDALDDVEHTDDYIKTIMEKPQKLDELDLDDYATHLVSKGKQNMKIVLDFIVSELTAPFADPRAYKEMDHKELFYKMTKMHPFDLQSGSLVNARIIRVTERNIICRLECGIEGNVFSQDVFDGKEITTNIPKKYHEGQVVTARVVGTNFDEKSKRREESDRENKTVDFTKLHLMLKPSMVTDHQKFLKELHPSTVNSFKIVPEEDFPVTQSTISKPVRHYARKINHPKFKNTSAQGALSYLEDKEIGDYVVRPSSKGMDHLTLTWKFYDGIYVHLDIKESAKGPTDKIGRKLHLKDQIYESIEELAAGYIHACNSFVKNIVTNNKFLNDNPTRIEEIVKQEKEENPKMIPYRFGFSVEAPQFAILYYAPKDYNIIKEYIKVRPNGLYFHDKVLQNIGQLISWFKSNYHKPEYHKFLKHAKPPVALPRTNAQVKGEKQEPQGPNTPTHLGRAFDGDIKVKNERDRDIYIKQEKGINVKEEENRGNFNNFDRDRNRPNRGGRPYQGDDRNRSRDFNRDRPPRERSKSREREKDRERPYRSGPSGRDQDKGDRYNQRDRSTNDRKGGYGGRDNQQGGGERRGSYNRGDRNDSARKDDFRQKREGGWGGQRDSPRGGGAKTSPGWGGNPVQEESKADNAWGASNSQWGNENTGDNGQGMKVKTEWKGNQQESGYWGQDNTQKMNVESAAVRVKQESDWGNDQGQSGGW